MEMSEQDIMSARHDPGALKVMHICVLHPSCVCRLMWVVLEKSLPSSLVPLRHTAIKGIGGIWPSLSDDAFKDFTSFSHAKQWRMQMLDTCVIEKHRLQRLGVMMHPPPMTFPFAICINRVSHNQVSLHMRMCCSHPNPAKSVAFCFFSIGLTWFTFSVSCRKL